MIKSLYTSTSGMIAQWNKMDVISNNLANVNTNAYKKDNVLFKSFPDMLLRRINDDGKVNFELGSYDVAPIIGKLGTGVETNDVYTDFSQGLNARRTENDFDMALIGEGFFVVETDRGHRYTRNGSFVVDENSFLVTQDGYRVLGENGAIKITTNNFRVKDDGSIVKNAKYGDELGEFIDKGQNAFEYEEIVDKFQIVTFRDLRHLKKEGQGLYVETPHTGRPIMLTVEMGRPKIMQGYLETSNVNVVSEMVKMIETQRAYEANQKVIQTADEIMGQIANTIAKI